MPNAPPGPPQREDQKKHEFCKTNSPEVPRDLAHRHQGPWSPALRELHYRRCDAPVLDLQEADRDETGVMVVRGRRAAGVLLIQKGLT